MDDCCSNGRGSFEVEHGSMCITREVRDMVRKGEIGNKRNTMIAKRGIVCESRGGRGSGYWIGILKGQGFSCFVQGRSVIMNSVLEGLR